MTLQCFLPDGGGNYDIVNNAVISTPGPQNHKAHNVSLRQSWEMNYQEAAIYLQVLTSSGLCHFECTDQLTLMVYYTLSIVSLVDGKSL